MSKPPALYVVGSRPAQRKVAALRFARAPLLTLPRETSWRDLVRRLAKSPLKT